MCGDMHFDSGGLVEPIDQPRQEARRDVLHDQQRNGELFRQARKYCLQHQRTPG